VKSFENRYGSEFFAQGPTNSYQKDVEKTADDENSSHFD
jgi:hypothetical protein